MSCARLIYDSMSRSDQAAISVYEHAKLVENEYVYVYVYTHINIDTYRYTNIYVHIHTYTHVCFYIYKRSIILIPLLF
jgi:hypothetical protein